MQFKLTFEVFKPLSLPLGHHSILQGFIYHLLKTGSPDYSSFLHEKGYRNEYGRKFKHFVFSTLRGDHKIEKGKDKRIVFFDRIDLEIRSCQPDFCNALLNAFQIVDIMELDHQPVRLSECSFTRKRIDKDSIAIKTLSPITLSYARNSANGQHPTVYLSPSDTRFHAFLNRNTKNKYRTAFGKDLHSDVTLDIISLEKDTYVTKLKNGFIVNAYNGKFLLSGDPDILSFLYDVGLGDRNSYGFGMFEPL